jgi:glycogen synthase
MACVEIATDQPQTLARVAPRTAGRRPARVLMTTETVGGVWTQTLELAHALVDHGVTVALATMGPAPSAAQRCEADEVPDLQLFEGDYRLEWMADPWDDVREAGDWLLALRDHVRPDVVHLSGYAHAALPWDAPVVVTAHSCRLSWWTAVHGETAPASWRRYRREVQRGLLAADVVAAPTRAMIGCLHQHYGPLACGRVIPHGRAPLHFLPRTKQPYVLGSGPLWDEARNLATLDEAARAVDWPVYLAGPVDHVDGPKVEARYAHSLGLLPSPLFAAWLGRASVFASPARYQPFGFPVLEAALSGCALVLGDIPSLRELWDEAAVFVEPSDPTALARALRSLIADATRRSLLGHRARARALDLTPARMAQGYLEAYALAGAASSTRETITCG